MRSRGPVFVFSALLTLDVDASSFALPACLCQYGSACTACEPKGEFR